MSLESVRMALDHAQDELEGARIALDTFDPAGVIVHVGRAAAGLEVARLALRELSPPRPRWNEPYGRVSGPESHLRPPKVTHRKPDQGTDQLTAGS